MDINISHIRIAISRRPLSFPEKVRRQPESNLTENDTATGRA